MNGKWLPSLIARRSFLSRLGAGAGILGATVVSRPAAAHAADAGPWQPTRHAEDDWFDKIPGEHRVAFDTTTPGGMALALRFAGNYFAANRDAYGLKDDDLAVVIIARHKSTAFGYSDSIWAKYGKYLSAQAEFTDPKTKEPPKVNVYASTEPDGMETLSKKGVRFAVCQMATRGIAGKIAEATHADTDSIVKEFAANLIAGARLVPAGIVAVNRAQERGYSLVCAS